MKLKIQIMISIDVKTRFFAVPNENLLVDQINRRE